MNKRKLKGKIVEVYGSQSAFCRATGFRVARLGNILSLKMQDRKATLADAALFYRTLGLTKDEYFDIFVNPYNQKEEETQK